MNVIWGIQWQNYRFLCLLKGHLWRYKRESSAPIRLWCRTKLVKSNIYKMFPVVQQNPITWYTTTPSHYHHWCRAIWQYQHACQVYSVLCMSRMRSILATIFATCGPVCYLVTRVSFRAYVNTYTVSYYLRVMYNFDLLMKLCTAGLWPTPTTDIMQQNCMLSWGIRILAIAKLVAVWNDISPALYVDPEVTLSCYIPFPYWMCIREKGFLHPLSK